MKRIDFIAGSLAALPLAAYAADAVTWTDSDGGKTVLRPFATAPFPHASRAQGHTYDKVFYSAAQSYSDPTVGIFVPSGYVRNDTVDFIVHFHGWRNNVATVLQHYNLRQQVAHSNVNAILLVPQGPLNAPDSGDGKLENDPNGFANFIAEALDFLRASGTVGKAATTGNIVLSAHSGGYAGLGGSLRVGGMNSHITDIMLFDAAYAYFDVMANWANTTPGSHVLSVFTDDTASGNAELMKRLTKRAAQTTVGAAQPLSLPAIQDRAPVFLYTKDVAHDEIMQKYNWFELFLQATALKPR